MIGKNNPQDLMKSYQRRQRLMRLIVGGLAVLLVATGIIILVVWLTGPKGPAISLFATKTPTPTLTFTPTATVPTPTASITPTATMTATVTSTATPTGPFQYKVQENETCWSIAQKFKVDFIVLAQLNGKNPATCPISVGDTILIPVAGSENLLPTATPLPTGFRGTIEYIIQTGETLAVIAARFNSTVDAILAANKTIITDVNKITAGITIKVPVNIVTATATRAPTSTAGPGTVAPTTKPAASATLTVTPKP